MTLSCVQVMSHNKERRSKRDEKLDKKSQAMEELRAEREKKKNRTGESNLQDDLLCSLLGFCLSLRFDGCSDLSVQLSSWPNGSLSRPARSTPTMRRKRKRKTTSHL